MTAKLSFLETYKKVNLIPKQNILTLIAYLINRDWI
jgi:hypothetical protein